LTLRGDGRKLRAMDALLSPLVESPQLVLYVNELQAVIEAERARREQFYEDISPEDKWEFINGEVIMHSPATDRHWLARARIERLLSDYLQPRDLGVVRGEKTLVAFTRNDYEPDIVYFPPAVARTLKPDQWKYPIPDLIVEVLSPSTEKLDRGTKKDDYAAHGVREYWIVDPKTEVIEQYVLAGRKYRLAGKRAGGSFVCKAIPGFVMLVRAAFDDEVNRQARLEFLRR
jgi:Uma2 family endonuclease